MSDHVYKLTEIVGTSNDGIDQAIRLSVLKARETLHNVRWFEVAGTRGMVDEAGGIQYQVTLKVGFTLDE